MGQVSANKKLGTTATLKKEAVFVHGGRSWRLRVQGECAVIHEWCEPVGMAPFWGSFIDADLRGERLLDPVAMKPTSMFASAGTVRLRRVRVPPGLIAAAERALPGAVRYCADAKTARPMDCAA